MRHKLLFLAIIFAALTFRLIGVNWDQGQHLHPDERFLTMVAQAMRWPSSVMEYLDTGASSLNPHNIGYQFYVYGTFPVIFVKWVSELLGMYDYGGITLVGRVMSALVDVGTLLVVVAIVRRISTTKAALISGFVYAISVLPIQLSHYFATDPYATFFMVATIYFLILFLKDKKFTYALALGLCFGLALSAKVSSVVLVVPIGLVFIVSLKQHWLRVTYLGMVSVLAAVLALRLFMPYLFEGFALNSEVLADWKELKSYDNPDGYFPPATMWINSTPYVFPAANMAFWGFGLPLFILAVSGLVYALIQRKNALWLIAFTIISIFAYQGGQFAKPLRYFYILYPLCAVLIGVLMDRFSRTIVLGLLALSLIWPLAFVHIYLQEHTRVAASKWIYENIPPGANLTCEHWDDCLPLNLPNFPGNGAYNGLEMTMYYPESKAKWQEISVKLSQADYLILSSNRVYGSTMSVPEKFPINTRFYELLFGGELGFKKVAEFHSRPLLPFPWGICINPIGFNYGRVSQLDGCQGLSFVDDYADEMFTVYDHPKVTIFEKVEYINYLEKLF